MPIVMTSTVGGEIHPNPFLGPTDFRAPVRTPAGLAGFTTDEIDQYGYLKQGVLLKRTGVLADGTVGEKIYGAVVEATKIAASNSAGDLAAAAAATVIVSLIGSMNRAVLEDSLGRAVSADELAALDGVPLVLIY